MKHGVESVLTVADMRTCARRRLPRAIFDAIDGGAGDELTLRENRAAYERIWFRPRTAADVSQRDLATTVLGKRVSMPLLLAPCGMARITNIAGERAAARAAARAGTIFALSGAASHSPESVFAEGGDPWYQLYLTGDRDDTVAVIGRVRDAGYTILCVTVDSPVVAARERDYRNRLELPPRISPRLVAGVASRPGWTLDFVRDRVADRGMAQMRLLLWRFAQIVQELRPATFEELRWIRELWDGPLVVKGVQRGDECAELLELGADGIVVSNHGGRQLDGVRATIDILPEVVDAVDGRCEVFLHGGIQRGADVVKALALGARACLAGKAYMFGLGAFGEAGVERVLEILRVEIDRVLAFVGCPTVGSIDSSIVEVRVPQVLGRVEEGAR